MKLHFHSDCPFFAGCENMLSCLLNSEDMRKKHELSFSYRYTALYEKGLQARIKVPIEKSPLRLPSINWLYSQIDRIVKNMLLCRILKCCVKLLLLKYLFFIYDIVRLYIFFNKKKPDILHINNGGYPGAYSCLSAVFAAKMAGIKRIILVINNIATPYNTLSRWIDKPIDRFIAQYTTLFITGSYYAKVQLCKIRRMSEEKVINIPNTIIRRTIIESKKDVLKRLSLGDEIILGNVALLEKRKGQEYLIKAFSMLKDRYRDFNKVKLLIEGSGKEEKSLKELVRSYSIEKNVIFLANEENIFDIINIFDIFVLPSIEEEDFPNVILEAMSLGKPIIGTRLSGIPEQVEDGTNGFLVAPKDIEGLLEAILFLLQNKKKMTEMGANSLKRFNSLFPYDKIINNYIDLYEDKGHPNN